MKERDVRRLNAIIIGAIGALTGVAAVQKNALAALIAVLTGMILMRLIEVRARADGIVVEDERAMAIACKASYRTIQVVVMVLLILGFLLNAMNSTSGDILLFITCLILIAYLIFYRYYASTLGGL
ncbi:MAG: DUF2178 domain-containing protein [Archaeoglobi archaeon]|nr:DUF2178 domain-containing protein [Candidatus Mnemosynella sp.]